MTLYKCYVRHNYALTNIFELGESIEQVTDKLIALGYAVIKIVKVRI